MLKNVKSSYFIQTIFSFVKEGNKLKVIKYNKDLQKEMNISLINYKFYSGRYIIYGQNGKGKEYNGLDNRLIFEGEYLNGKRNGKGKEYYNNGQSSFEGEYRDDRQLEGKIYDKTGNIIYEIKNIDGKGKEYQYGNLIFEGEYLDGKRNGKGKEYDWNGDLIFDGEYLNGERNGKGKEYYYKSKLEFEGEYVNGKKWEGKGYNIFGNIIAYELNEGKGLIKEYHLNGKLRFEGKYINGERNGKGKEYNIDGDLVFEGEYLNGERKKKGFLYFFSN